MTDSEQPNSLLQIVFRATSLAVGLLLIVGPLSLGLFSLTLIVLGALLLAGAAVPDLLLALFGQGSFFPSAREMQREAKERSDRLLGRDKNPHVPPVDEEEVLRSLQPPREVDEAEVLRSLGQAPPRS